MAEIELICPGCKAGYGLPADAIPPAGREVECSRCGHVWLATPPAPEGPLDLGMFTRPGSPAGQGAGPRRPAPANGGRRAQDRGDDGDDLPAAAPLPPASRRLSPDMLDLLRDEVEREQRLREAETGTTGTTEDGTPEGGTPDEGDISRPGFLGDEIDWPATTVTLPAGSTRSMSPTAQPPVLLTPAAGPVAATEPSPAPPSAVIRSVPPRSAAPVAALRADTSSPVRSPPASSRPSPVAPTARPMAYRAGLGLGVMLAAGIVAVYVLAPMVQPQDGPLAQTLAGWRTDLDLARLWLDMQVRRLRP